MFRLIIQFHFYRSLIMEEEGVHFSHILLYYFRRTKTHCKHTKRLHIGYENNALKEKKCKNLVAKFRVHIQAIADSKRLSTIREIEEMFDVLHTCMEKKLNILAVLRKSTYGFFIG